MEVESKHELFLWVFYFIDDFSQPNLRIKAFKRIWKRTIAPVKIQGRDVIREGKEQAIMTWAPSHVEMGLLPRIASVC